MATRMTRLLVAAVLAAGSTLISVEPASARVVIKAKANNKWSAGGHHFAKIGEKVVWKNPTSGPHDVKSYNQGKTWRLGRKQLKTNSRNKVVRGFKKRGNYYFRCTLHSSRDENGNWEGMVGIVHARRG
ncbi:MAG: cupredoxin domain-containing protein [Actinomycetota bacterium]